MPKTITIGKRTIGEGHPVFIMAEAGVNHNGDTDLAKQLIDAAAASKADAVKFQTFDPEKLVTKTAAKAQYQGDNEAGADPNESQFDMLKRLQLSYEDHKILKAYAENKGLIFISTPFSIDDADFLYELGMPAYKVGSSDTNNIPYLRHIATRGVPIILSTGMSTLEEVHGSVDAIKKAGNNQIIVLHCTSRYPTPPEDVNLRAMLTMKEKLGTLVGFSDHTMGIEIPIAAVALGARLIEKHFTLDRNLPGPDHKASLEPAELAAMVTSIRNVERALGTGIKKPSIEEMKVAEVARKSLLIARQVTKGNKITPDDIKIMRPGTGISPDHYDKVIGMTAARNIKPDEILDWQMLK